MSKELKTNAIRQLDAKKIPYKLHLYECDGFMDGISVAEKCGQDPLRVFKTIVTISPKKKIYVFVLPSCKEIDLKKAAQCVNEKSVAMLPLDELLATTGYVRGGCSPIGMKKSYETVVEKSALAEETILFSGGRRGIQIEMDPRLLKEVCRCTFGGFAKETLIV